MGGKAGEEVGQILHGVEDPEEGVLLGGAATSGKILTLPVPRSRKLETSTLEALICE